MIYGEQLGETELVPLCSAIFHSSAERKAFFVRTYIPMFIPHNYIHCWCLQAPCWDQVPIVQIYEYCPNLWEEAGLALQTWPSFDQTLGLQNRLQVTHVSFFYSQREDQNL